MKLKQLELTYGQLRMRLIEVKENQPIDMPDGSQHLRRSFANKIEFWCEKRNFDFQLWNVAFVRETFQNFINFVD